MRNELTQNFVSIEEILEWEVSPALGLEVVLPALDVPVLLAVSALDVGQFCSRLDDNITWRGQLQNYETS